MLAYLVLTHRSPRQLLRLATALDDPRAEIFVHVDLKAEEAQFRYMLRHHPRVHFVRPRHIVTWGGWSMVRAELTLIRAALAAGAQHVVLLSGSDYPLWSNDRLVKHFLEGDRSYMEHYRIPSLFWDRRGLNRVHQYWLCDDPIPLRSRLWRRTAGRLWTPFWHRVLRYGGNQLLKLGYELGLRRRTPEGLELHIGSQWWSMSRPCAEYVLDFVERRPDVVRFYRHCHVPDEGFFQTVLLNSPLADRIVNDSHRYVEWDGDSNPRVLERTDLDAILEADPAFFRKVSLGGEIDPGRRLRSSEELVRAVDARRGAPDAGEG